jgi:hypothetical protein
LVIFTFVLFPLLVIAGVGFLATQSSVEQSRRIVSIEIPKNAQDPTLNVSLVMVDDVPVSDGWYLVSLRERPAIRVVNKNDPFAAGIIVYRVLYFPNGTKWGERVYESPLFGPGESVVYEFDRPGDYAIATAPWPWLGSIKIRVTP